MNCVEMAKCRVRKDSVLIVETLITASSKFMMELPANEQVSILSEHYRLYEKRSVKITYLRATVHMDE